MPTPREKQRIEARDKRRAQLLAEAQKLTALNNQDKRKLDTRQKIIVGAAVIAHAALDPAFADTLRDALKKSITRDTDWSLVPESLGGGVITAPPDQEPEQPIAGEFQGAYSHQSPY